MALSTGIETEGIHLKAPITVHLYLFYSAPLCIDKYILVLSRIK